MAPTGIALPDPSLTGKVSLEETLTRRRSVRDFTNQALTPEQLSQLLWATQGETADWGGRTAPSAGATYPLELYLASNRGLHRYLPQEHRLEVVHREDVRARLREAAHGQVWIETAPAVFVLAAEETRTSSRYGTRATRYVAQESGHAAENLCLQAVALGLGSVLVGAYEDEAVREILGLPREQVPLYLVPVGVPAEA